MRLDLAGRNLSIEMLGAPAVQSVEQSVMLFGLLAP